MNHLPIRLRLTLTCVVLLVTVTAPVLGSSWLLLERHSSGAVPAQYADAVLAQLGRNTCSPSSGRRCSRSESAGSPPRARSRRWVASPRRPG